MKISVATQNEILSAMNNLASEGVSITSEDFQGAPNTEWMFREFVDANPSLFSGVPDEQKNVLAMRVFQNNREEIESNFNA